MSKTKSKQETANVSSNLVLQINDVKNAVKSYVLSKKYVKRLVKITVLNVLYHRIDIPRNEFESKSFDSIPYFTFNKNSKNDFIKTFTSVAYGIIDAIDKDYLKQINMYIVTKGTREILEHYTIKVKYNKEESAAPTRKSAKLKSVTKEYLSGLTQLPGNQWKESDVELFIELLYNEDTPADYEPPNFKSEKEPFASSEPKYYIVGKADTGFHKVTTYGTGRNFVVSRASTPTPSMVNTQEYMEVIEIEDDEERTPKEGVTSSKNVIQTFEDSAVSGEINWVDRVDDQSTGSAEECPCMNLLPDYYKGIRCMNCCNIVHITCHGHFTINTVDDNSFICYACANKSGIDEDLRLLMRLRTTIYGIHRQKSFSPNLLRLSKTEVNSVMEKLEELNILKSSDPSVINFDQLQKAIEHLFTSVNSQYLE